MEFEDCGKTCRVKRMGRLLAVVMQGKVFPSRRLSQADALEIMRRCGASELLSAPVREKDV